MPQQERYLSYGKSGLAVLQGRLGFKIEIQQVGLRGLESGNEMLI